MLAALLELAPSGVEQVDGEGFVEYAVYGAPGELPAPVPADGDHVFHQYVVACDDRDELRAHLERQGVGTGIHYPVAIHRSQAYASAGLGPGSLPVSERMAGRICSLPMHPSPTDEEIARVAGAVHAFADVRAAA